MSKNHFISKELRPKVGATLDEYPVFSPGTSEEDLRGRVDQLLLASSLTKHEELPSMLLQWTEPIEINSDVVWTLLDDEIVLLNLESKMPYTLNSTAAYIWSLIANNTTVENIVSSLCSDFEIPDSTACEDVVCLLSHLRTEGIIRKRR